MEKARTTLAPARFSRVMPLISSSERCTLPFLGMVIAMISQINPAMIKVTARKISPIFQSIMSDATSAPTTMNGERKKSRRKRLTPFSD